MHGYGPQDIPPVPIPLFDMSPTARLVLMTFALHAAGAAAGTVDLEDCRISAGPAFPTIKARCGTLERPVNPDDAQSPLLELEIALVPALNLEPEPDPIVPLAGGPGQGAIQFYSAYAHAFGHVRRDRDILLVDQRGTGGSARLDCPVDEDLIEGQYSTETTIRYTRECLETLAHDPRFFTSSIAVADLEAVRIALDIPALNLYGVSYGSRVAQHYARRYPEATRTIVLDGVVPPQLALGPDIALEAQRVLDTIFARCALDPPCDERFPGLSASFEALKKRLDAKPAKLELAHPLTGVVESISFGRLELAAAVRLLAYHPNTVALLPLMISEAADGRYAPLAAQYQMTTSSLSESLALGMHNAVMCSEDVPFYDASRIDGAALDASFIGPLQLAAIEAMCSVWPRGPVDADFKEPLATGIPTLLLSGGADPVTPPSYADLAAQAFRRAWLLTQPDQGHGQLVVGCMPRIFEQFVQNRGLDGVDTSCMERSFVMPFFLGYSGPAP